MTDMVIGRDDHLVPNSGIPFSDDGSYVTLAATGTTSIAVPAGMNVSFIQIQSGATVFCGKEAITYTSSTSWQTCKWDIDPAVRIDVVGGTDTLYFYALDAAVIKVSFYRR